MEHITDLGVLFEEVQLQSIFPDGKTFVDCRPRLPISDIRDRYISERALPNFSLSSFVEESFELPELPTSQYEIVAGRPIEEHIQLLWKELTRKADESGSSLIRLPNLFVVPGGRFREMFYWDSYFTMLGLAVSNQLGLIGQMTENFSFLIKEFGYIPNGNRTYFLGRSQPPFFASMIKLLSEAKTEEKILIRYLPELEREYAFWMRGADELTAVNNALHRVVMLPDGQIMNRYWDESDTPRPESYKEDVELAHNVTDKEALYRNIRAACESGWDFSSRWFQRDGDFASLHTTQIIPVDLNCLLFNLESTIAEAYIMLEDVASADTFTTLAASRAKAINTYCWNSSEQFYFDFDFVRGEVKQEWTLAAVSTIYFGVADHDQAQRIASILEERFLCSGGLRTTTKQTIQQWDAPNGWAPLQWLAIKGLMNYGLDDLARKISGRWTRLNEKVYANTGKMMEKYNVVSTDLPAGGGEYQSQDGFGWTNGVYLALKKMFG